MPIEYCIYAHVQSQVDTLSLAGYTSIRDILCMTKEDRDGLQMEQQDEYNNTILVPLLHGKCGLICAFQGYVRHLQQEKQFVSYMKLTSDGFDNYWLTTHDPNQPLPPPTPLSNVHIPFLDKMMLQLWYCICCP